jgi:peptide/nickel transport system permease protein
VVQACLLVIALLYVLVNLVVDLLYPVFDPRMKL